MAVAPAAAQVDPQAFILPEVRSHDKFANQLNIATNLYNKFIETYGNLPSQIQENCNAVSEAVAQAQAKLTSNELDAQENGNTVVADAIKHVAETFVQRKAAQRQLEKIEKVFREVIQGASEIYTLLTPQGQAILRLCQKMNCSGNNLRKQYQAIHNQIEQTKEKLASLPKLREDIESTYYKLKQIIEPLAYQVDGGISERFTLRSTPVVNRLRDKYIANNEKLRTQLESLTKQAVEDPDSKGNN